jgi:5-formaminoimidazole-4-carboxamide-1-beta-D-ribofuranosyl 5'-monophosphate synthetase
MIAPELLPTPAQQEESDFYTIATLGSHSALQILKGAHDEGFKTLAIANGTPSGSTARSTSSTK